MGLFNTVKNVFTSSEMPDYWTVLDSPDQIEGVIQDSKNRPQLIYKHSHRCATCFFARKQVEEAAEAITKQAELYFVDVIGSRPVSTALADTLDVRHESPQIILLSKGEVLWHESHGGVKGEAILTALNKD